MTKLHVKNFTIKITFSNTQKTFLAFLQSNDKYKHLILEK